MIQKKKVARLIRSPSVVAVLMAALMILPAAQVDAVPLIDDIIPSSQESTIPTGDASEQEPTRDTAPLPQASDTDASVDGDTAVPLAPIEVVVEQQAAPTVTVEAPVVITPVVQAPVGVGALPVSKATAQPSITRPVQQATSPQKNAVPVQLIPTISRKQIALPANQIIQRPTGTIRVTQAVPANVGVSVAQPARLNSDVEYSSNQLTPQIAQKYYHAALIASGLGVLLYGLTLLPRLQSFSSFINRSI